MKRWFAVILTTLFLSASFACAEDSLCASVEMEISQEAALERQAFNARLVIHNGLAGISLTDVAVTMNFTDGAGNSVSYSSDPDATTNLFFVAAPSLQNINVLPGGTVSGGTSAEINWLIVPTVGASDDNPDGKIYYVGATLTYKINGEPTEMEIAPDYIYVKPLPLLALDYFLPGNVYGDDAFTFDVVEPAVPFAFGLRVRNQGPGDAHNMKLVSSQPQITANEQGLAVDMKLLGSAVDGRAVTPSLALDFGDIESMETKMGYWIMEVSLSGKFTNFTAEVSHADEVGGEMTSLIPQTNVHAHLFLKDVLVDLPDRDNVIDFLVDGDSTVYESDGTDSTAEKCVSAYMLPSGADHYTFELNSSTTQQLVYATVTNPCPSGELKSVVRSDGKRIAASNAWLSKVREGGGIEWHYYFNLFDVDGADYTYTVVFEDSSASNLPPVIYPVSSRLAYPGRTISVTVAAYDPDGTIPQLSVSSPASGFSFVPNTNVGDLAVGTLSWTPSAGDIPGSPYDFIFTASDGIDSSTGRCFVTVLNTPDNTNCPAWWINRGVINTNTANDYAPVNAGQLKYLAAMAWEEFNQLPGGAGIPAFDSFTNGNDYVAVNLGQVKYLAAQFYDRLGVTNYPWLSSTNPPKDYAMANIGQVKYLFSFDPLKDSDADGMPDWWEELYGAGPTALAPEANPDNDGRSNLSEYLNGTDPTVSD